MELKKELDVLGGLGKGNITAQDTWKHLTDFWHNDTSLTGAIAYMGYALFYFPPHPYFFAFVSNFVVLGM